MIKKALIFSIYLAVLTALFTLLSLTALAAPMTPHGTARFETPTATVNITNNSRNYQTVWRDAIRAWNRTGAFSFVLSKQPDAQITAQSNPSIDASYTGFTVIHVNNQDVINQVTSTLNPTVMATFGYRPSQEVNVAEHELGHAMGLFHSPNKDSVMYAANRFVSIQPADVASVQNLYATQAPVSNGTLSAVRLRGTPVIRPHHSGSND